MREVKAKRKRDNKYVIGWYAEKVTGSFVSDRFVENTESIIITKLTDGGMEYAEVFPDTVKQIRAERSEGK